MSNVKLAPTRILQVIPSDYCDIPYPTIAYEYHSGSNTIAVGTDILDNNVDNPFQVQNSSGDWINIVNPGDVVYFEADVIAATVAEVLSPSQIKLNAAILTPSNTYSFTVYQNSLFPNQGCQLLVTGQYDAALDLTVRSAGQDGADGGSRGILLKGVQPQVLPFQIVRLFDDGTTAVNNNYIAMW
jgi:hypothetical protein